MKHFLFFLLLFILSVVKTSYAFSSDCKIDYKKICKLMGYKSGDDLQKCIEGIKAEEQINLEAEKEGLLDKQKC